MDLKSKIDERFEVFCNEGAMDEIIDKQLRQTMESTVKDIMNYDMQKDIREQLKEVLKFDFSKYDFSPVLATFSGIVRTVLEKALNDNIAETTRKAIESIVLGEVRPEYKLSDLIMEMLKEKSESEGITLIIEDDTYSFTWVYIDEDEDTAKYKCKYRIMFYNGEFSSFWINDEDAYKSLAFSKHIIGIEKALCACYFHGSKLILDQGTDADYYCTVKEYDY